MNAALQPTRRLKANPVIPLNPCGWTNIASGRVKRAKRRLQRAAIECGLGTTLNQNAALGLTSDPASAIAISGIDLSSDPFGVLVEIDEHVPGWEVYDIANLFWEGKLADGREIEQVRIVFPNREMAEREKRPLKDVGAKVCYEDENGELLEIED